MNKMRRLDLRGVLVAVVTPFTDDLAIDEADLRQHVRRLAAVPGVTGFVCNAHAAEVEALDPTERRRCVEIVREEAPAHVVVGGVRASSTANAVGYARAAAAAGRTPDRLRARDTCWRAADAPVCRGVPQGDRGGGRSPDDPVPVSSGERRRLSARRANQMVDEIDSVVAVKMCHGGELAATSKTCKRCAPPAPDRHLAALAQYFLPYFSLGADGALTAVRQRRARMDSRAVEAVQQGDLPRALALHSDSTPSPA